MTDAPVVRAVVGPVVVAVSTSDTHDVRKANRPSIRLVAGHGVEGDAHAGATVQHLSRVRRDPTQPNLRQVHLVHAELHAELRDRDPALDIAPGAMGENITTAGLDLLGLARGTRLRLGDEAVIEVTGLRDPCRRLEEVADGLMGATLARAADGSLVRKAGVMAVVLVGGEVRPGDRIVVLAPEGRPEPLAPV